MSDLGLRVSGFGSRVLGSRVSGFGSRVSGLWFRVFGFGSRVSGSRVSGLGFRELGLGLGCHVLTVLWDERKALFRASIFGFQCAGSHMVDYESVIKRHLAARHHQLSGLVRYKFGHNTPQIMGKRNPRSTPIVDTSWRYWKAKGTSSSLPSEEGSTSKGLKTTWKPRQDPGLDYIIRAEFTRQQIPSYRY